MITSAQNINWTHCMDKYDICLATIWRYLWKNNLASHHSAWECAPDCDATLIGFVHMAGIYYFVFDIRYIFGIWHMYFIWRCIVIFNFVTPDWDYFYFFVVFGTKYQVQFVTNWEAFCEDLSILRPQLCKCGTRKITAFCAGMLKVTFLLWGFVSTSRKLCQPQTGPQYY